MVMLIMIKHCAKFKKSDAWGYNHFNLSWNFRWLKFPLNKLIKHCKNIISTCSIFFSFQSHHSGRLSKTGKHVWPRKHFTASPIFWLSSPHHRCTSIYHPHGIPQLSHSWTHHHNSQPDSKIKKFPIWSLSQQ